VEEEGRESRHFFSLVQLRLKKSESPENLKKGTFRDQVALYDSACFPAWLAQARAGERAGHFLKEAGPRIS
jgi:hypothetical protein